MLFTGFRDTFLKKERVWEKVYGPLRVFPFNIEEILKHTTKDIKRGKVSFERDILVTFHQLNSSTSEVSSLKNVMPNLLEVSEFLKVYYKLFSPIFVEHTQRVRGDVENNYFWLFGNFGTMHHRDFAVIEIDYLIKKNY
jgi:hypothetical protein